MLAEVFYIAKRFVVNTVCWLHDWIVWKKSKFEPQEVKSVLVMKLDAMGDFILWCRFAQVYEKKYPKGLFKKILVLHPSLIELASRWLTFDEYIGLDRKRFMLDFVYRRSMINKLDVVLYHRVIYHTYSMEYASGALLAKGLQSEEKLGFESDTAIDSALWVGLAKSYFSQLYHREKYYHSEVEKHRSWVESMGLKEDSDAPLKIESCDCQDWDLPNEYIVLAPGARASLRRWPKEYWLVVARWLLENTTYSLVLTGSKEEQGLCAHLQISDRVVDLSGKASIAQLGGVLTKAKLVIGSESGPIHFASALGVHSVSITGGGHFGRFVPYPQGVSAAPKVVNTSMPCYGCDWKCKFKVSLSDPVPCISAIEPQQVIEAVQTSLDAF